MECDARSCVPGQEKHIVTGKLATTRKSEIMYSKRPRNVLFTKKWHDEKITKAMVAFATRVKLELNVRMTGMP